MERFLLCRPRGGLNDILCNIKYCYDYACRFNRTLVIDTLTRTYISTNFGNIFEFNDSRVITHVDSMLLKKLTELDNFSYCFPHNKKWCLEELVENLNFETNSNIDFNKLYAFDFEKDYPQSVLYYDKYGGGEQSYLLFAQNISSFNKKLVRYVISLLPSEEYESIHIRHTDLRTKNYFQFLERLKPQLNNKKVLICSDNNQVKQECIDFLGKDVAFTITDTPESNSSDEPLHHIPLIKTFEEEQNLFLKLKNNHYPFNSKDFNIQTVNSLVDLLGLIFSSNIHACPISEHRMSGYSQLALNIQRDEKLVARLKQC